MSEQLPTYTYLDYLVPGASKMFATLRAHTGLRTLVESHTPEWVQPPVTESLDSFLIRTAE